jgi:hypothetical protein
MFLDIIRRPVFIQKHRPVYFSKYNVLETVSGPEIGTSSIHWTKLSRFYLKTETESSLQYVVF